MSAADGLPPRPYVPPAAAGAVLALLTAVTLIERAWIAHAEGAPAPVGAAVAPAVAAGCALAAMTAWGAVRRAGGSRCAGEGGRVQGNGPSPRRRAPRRLWGPWMRWALAGILLGSLSSAWWMVRMDGAAAAFERVAAAERLFVIEGDPVATARGISTTALMIDGSGRGAARVRLTLPEVAEAGRVLRVTARVRPLIEGAWARSRYLHGEVASVEAVRVREVARGARDPIGGLRSRILAAMDPAASPARALVAGVVCGRTSELNRTPARDAFATAGLTHLVAVSGSHLALIAAIVAGALRRGFGSPRARSAVLIALMGAYVVFTGCAPSAVRSLVMVAAALAANGFRRRAHTLSSLALAVMALVALDPACVYDLGFQLSSASVLGLAGLAPYVGFHLERAGVPPTLARPLACTLTAQVMTVPITAPAFGSVSLVAPLANLVVGPVMSALLVVSLPIAPVAALFPGDGLMALPEGLANLSIWCATILSGLPAAAFAVDVDAAWAALVYAAAAAVFALWREVPRRGLLAGSAALAVAVALWAAAWRFAAPPALTVLDVGQADAILIRDGPAAVLVDAGVDGGTARALARQHVLHLDAILITHWDRDHWGGIAEVLDTVACDRVIVARGAAAQAPSEVRAAWAGRIEEVAHGDEIRVGGFTCRVVWPREEVAGGENGESLCLDVSFERGGASLRALLTGDTELSEERAYAGEVGDVDALKVGHHGSRASVDAGLLEVLRPEVAVASAGERNTYGHPSRECVAALERAGAAFLSTKDAGDVSIEPDHDGVRVRAPRAPAAAEVG